MVENQLRPNKIKDQDILELFLKTEKEKFLHENQINIAYSDIDLQIVKSGNFSLESPSKQTFEWERVSITYDIAIYDGAVLFKEINHIETNDTYVD